MDPTLIPRLAREAGLLRLSFILNHNREIADEVMQLAALVADQCAKVCDAKVEEVRLVCNEVHVVACAQAIREQFKEQP